MQAIIYPHQHRPVFVQQHLLAALLSQSARQTQALFNSLPPSSLVLLSSFAMQAGNALSKQLFDSLGSTGAALVCHGVAAILMLLIWQPRWQNHSLKDYVLVLGLALAIAGASLGFYGAIARIPLGVASALDFIGPLGVAILGSRRLLDLLWVILAAIGIVLISPISGTSLDPIGIVLALFSAVSWATFILISAPVGRVFPGGAGLSLAMAVAVILMLPFGISQTTGALLNLHVWVVATAVALLSIVLPYTLEFKALKRLPPRVFGVLVSIEPAIAALVGLIFLKEQLEIHSLMAIVMITITSIGVTLSAQDHSGHS